MKKENHGKAFATLKRLSAKPGDCQELGSFTLESHVRENIRTEEQIEINSDFFVSVSQEFLKFDIS